MYFFRGISIRSIDELVETNFNFGVNDNNKQANQDNDNA